MPSATVAAPGGFLYALVSTDERRVDAPMPTAASIEREYANHEKYEVLK
jgi:hypothetical protein